MNPTEAEKTPEQLDIEYLQSQLETLHPNLYQNVNEETFSASLSQAVNSEPEYFELALQESLALLKDAHTHVFEDFWQKERMPLKFLEIDHSFYIIGAPTSEDSLLGNKILEINGRPLENILPELLKLSSKEGPEVVLGDLVRYLQSNKILRYYGFSTSDEVNITTETGEKKVKVNDSKAEELYRMNPLVWKKKERENNETFEGNPLYHFRMEGDTLLFQYNDCANNGYSDEYLADFKSKLLERTKKSKSIVVDLRLNDGGTTDVMEDLFNSLPNNQPIYVAIGRKTFSSAMHHMLFLKIEKHAILIGENAGQRPNRFGDCEKFVLPHSKIKIHVSSQRFELLPGQDLDVIEPDIRIPVTIEDYKNNTDPLNKWIKENL